MGEGGWRDDKFKKKKWGIVLKYANNAMTKFNT